MSHELGAFYDELYSASPVLPMGIAASEYLGQLFEPGELVLVTEANSACALWESQTSPAVGSYKTAFFPHALDPVRLQSLEGTQGAVVLSRMVSQFKYAAMRFGDDEAAHLFPEIIGRRLPVVSVVSVGQWDSDILFRVDAATHREWNRACKRLSEIIRAQFGYETKFKLQSPALLPSAEVEQRLMYFNPRLL